MTTKESDISVIVCTKDRPVDLGVTLDSIAQQTTIPDILVVVDDGDATKTRYVINNSKIRQKTSIIYLPPTQQVRGLTAARNRGIAEVVNKAKIAIFLDDDITLDKNYIEVVKGIFTDRPGVSGITCWLKGGYSGRPLPIKVLLLLAGKILPKLIPVSMFKPKITYSLQALYPIFKPPIGNQVDAQWLSGCNMAYRMSLFEEGVRFDENLNSYAPAEDVLFSNTLYLRGKQLVLSHEAQVEHRSSAASRISKFKELVMVFGYRNYISSQLSKNELSSTLRYYLFAAHYAIAAAILAGTKYRGSVEGAIKEVYTAYSLAGKYDAQIKSGNLEGFNKFLQTLP